MLNLNSWLFEEQVLTTEEQLGILNDYIFGHLHNEFPDAKLEQETIHYIVWNLKNLGEKSIKLFFYPTGPTLAIGIINNQNAKWHDSFSSLGLNVKNNEQFIQQLTDYFEKNKQKIEKYIQFEYFLKQIKQEIVEYFGSNIVKTDGTGIYVKYKIPNTMLKVVVDNNHVNLQVYFKTVDAQGNEDLGADMFIKLGDNFKSKISKNWDKINQVLENSFRLAGAN